MDAPNKPPHARHHPHQHHSHLGGWIAVSVYMVGVAIWYFMWPYLH